MLANHVELNLHPAVRVVVHAERDDLVAVRIESSRRANCGTADRCPACRSKRSVSYRAATSTAPSPPRNSPFFGSSGRAFLSPVTTHVPSTYQAFDERRADLRCRAPARCGRRRHRCTRHAAPIGPCVQSTSVPTLRRVPLTNIGSKKVNCDMTVRPRSPFGRTGSSETDVIATLPPTSIFLKRPDLAQRRAGHANRKGVVAALDLLRARVLAVLLEAAAPVVQSALEEPAVHHHADVAPRRQVIAGRAIDRRNRARSRRWSDRDRKES